MTTISRNNRTVVQTLLALSLLLCFALPAQAQMKLGTVNLRKVFEGYYKTKQADEQLKEQTGDAEKVLKGMLDDYQKAVEDYKKLREAVGDQAVSLDEREKRKKNADAKLTEVQQLEGNVKQYRQDNMQRLNDKKMRMREGVLKDINERLVTKAKALQFNLLFDTSAESADRTNVILFIDGVPDLSDEILNELNATAPAGFIFSDKETNKPPTEKK